LVECRGGHLPDGHVIANAGAPYQLAKVLVDVGTVGIEASAVPLVVVLERCGLGDEVHHVEAEAAHAPALPELDDLCQGIAHLGVVPVEVCLRDVKEMQVPLAQRWHVLPGGTPELRRPAGGSHIRIPIPEDVVVLVALVAREGALEPLVRR